MEVSCVTLPFQLNFICRYQLGYIRGNGHASSRSQSFDMLSLIEGHRYDYAVPPN